jgi:molecular chaperone DnaK
MPDSTEEDSETQKVLVLDLGGGVFDATLFECKGSQVTALATDGDNMLGGCDWDDRLADVVADQFVAEHGVDPRKDANAAGRLRRACEAAKCSMSSSRRATITFQFRGRSTRARTTREQLEEISGDLIDRARATMLRTLKAAGVGWGSIDQVLLVGESSRMPIVRQMVREVSGKDPDMSALEYEAVAHGAALQAANHRAKKEGSRLRFKITEINSHSLGVVGIDPRTGHGRNAVLIPRNTALPATTKRTFKTKQGERDSLRVRIIQGESKSPDKCTRIGKCDVGSLPAELPPDSAVTVEFHYGANGRLTVFIETEANARRVAKEITRAAGLSQEHLDRWREWVETMTLCSNV